MADRFYIGTGIFNDTARWSTSSGGAGGASVPGTADKAIFDGSSGTCTPAAAVNVGGLDMQAGWAGALNMGANNLTVGSQHFKLDGGTFNGGSGTHDINGNVSGTGGTWNATTGETKVAPAGPLTMNGGLTFVHNNGTFHIDPGGSPNTTFEPPAAAKFFNFKITHASFQFSGGFTNPCKIAGNMEVVSIGNGFLGTYELEGDYQGRSGSNAFWTATIKFVGTGNQTIKPRSGFNDSQVPSIEINKPSGTLFLQGEIQFQANPCLIKYVAGTIDQTALTKIKLLNKKVTFDFPANFEWTAAEFEVATGSFDFEILQDMAIAGKFIITSAGVTTVQGGKTLTLTGDASFRDSALGDALGFIRFAGTGDQYVDTNSGTGAINAVKVDKPSGTLFLQDSILRMTNNNAGGWEWIQGTVDPGTSELKLDTRNKTIDTGSGGMQFYKLTFDSIWTMTIVGTVDVLDELRFTKAATVNGGTIRAFGNIVSTDTSMGGTVTIEIVGANNQTIDAGGFDLPDGPIIVNKSGGELSLASNLVLNGTGQDFTLTHGTFYLNGFDLTVPDQFNVDSNLALDGDETISAAAININFGSHVTYRNAAVTAPLATLTTTYHHLTLTGGKTHTIPAGVGNGITVNGRLCSNGTRTNKAVLASATPATAAELSAATGRLLWKANITDIDASGGNEVGAPDSTDGGGNTNIRFTKAARPVVRIVNGRYQRRVVIY